MKPYEIHQLANVVAYLSRTEAMAGKDGDGDVWPKQIHGHHRPHVEEARRQCELIELAGSVRRCDLFLKALKPGLRWLELKNQAKVLLEEIEGELHHRRFAFVTNAKATIHDSLSKDWADVWATFPSSKADTEAATDCYALEQHTASVFHLMRVAEFGLRALAKKLRVKITHKGKACPVEYGDWGKVITEIKSKITLAHALPAGPKRQTKLEFYSDAADHCTFMKDIWRNNVSHTRKVYNESEALAVLSRVKGFMAFLARI
jgi:hypothetical protein